MKITDLGTESNGTRNFMMRTHVISYRALLRCIRRIPGAVITKARHNPLTYGTEIIVEYKDITIKIETVWADNIISCNSSSTAFDEFVSKLSSHKVKLWEYLF